MKNWKIENIGKKLQKGPKNRKTKIMKKFKKLPNDWKNLKNWAPKHRITESEFDTGRQLTWLVPALV